MYGLTLVARDTSLVCHTATMCRHRWMFLQKFSVMIYPGINVHFYIHQTDWTSSLNLTDVPWIVQGLLLFICHYKFPLHDLTALCFWTISSTSLENPKKYISATWLYSVDFYEWYFDLSRKLFSSMILWWWHSARGGHKGGQKNCTPNSWQYLCQFLTFARYSDLSRNFYTPPVFSAPV